MRTIWVGLALLGAAGACDAQMPGAEAPIQNGPFMEPDVRAKNVDPSAVEIPLYVGAKVSDVLRALED